MKLENYVNKTDKKIKVLLISLGTIVLISVSLLLYKTFASFNEHVEFPMMNGKVDYFGNSDVYFAFYKGDEQLEQMPKRDNSENLAFKRGECDNGASIVWNEEEWAPLVKNLSKSKTKCSLYFEETTPFVREVVKCGQGGTAATSCITNNVNLNETDLAYDGKEVLGELGTDENNLRFVGANPSNYVLFNNGELWRIIGVMNNITEVSEDENQTQITKSHLKIIRKDSIGSISFDSNLNNDWSLSDLQKVLNSGVYWNKTKGECSSKTCDFQDTGLDLDAKKYISNVIYSNGSFTNGAYTPSNFYKNEHNNNINWTGKIGIMYASESHPKIHKL